jgi:OOP family OmpA-OmpF porin
MTDAAHFSRKGLEAASGKIVLPEDPTDWRIADNQLDGMHQGRDTLVSLLDQGGRDKAPEFSAVAQARFDCWVVESTRIFGNSDDQQICRAGFKEALDQARAEVDKPDYMPPAIPQGPNREEELRAAKFLVFFNWNKSNVTSAAEKVIDTAISEAQRLGAHQINVIGNADKSGTERYNKKLSMARALAVKQRLTERGISPQEITVTANGDEHPLVETARGVREPANRRVEIHFE